MRSISKLNTIESRATSGNPCATVTSIGGLCKNGEMMETNYHHNRRQLIYHEPSMFEDTFLKVLGLYQIHTATVNPELATKLKAMYELIYYNRRFRVFETTNQTEANSYYIRVSPQHRSPEKYLSIVCNARQFTKNNMFYMDFDLYDYYCELALCKIHECESDLEEDADLCIPLTNPKVIDALILDMQIKGNIYINLDFDITDAILYNYNTGGFVLDDDDVTRHIRDLNLGFKGDILRCMILDILNNGFVHHQDILQTADKLEMKEVLYPMVDYHWFVKYFNVNNLDVLMIQINDNRYYALGVDPEMGLIPIDIDANKTAQDQ